jgi:peptide deformylase
MIKSNGIGIAAPQVGRLLNIFITDTDFGRYGIKKSNPLIFINPTIINTSEETALREEGCLSFPGVYSNVRRNTEIQIQALNYEGNHFTLDFFDFEAACHLHEYSHLQGKTIREYLGVPERSRVLNNIKKIQRENKRNNK